MSEELLYPFGPLLLSSAVCRENYSKLAKAGGPASKMSLDTIFYYYFGIHSLCTWSWLDFRGDMHMFCMRFTDETCRTDEPMSLP